MSYHITPAPKKPGRLRILWWRLGGNAIAFAALFLEHHGVASRRDGRTVFQRQADGGQA